MSPPAQWNVVVWNDPINLMGYVVWVLRRNFGLSQAAAATLMMRVHDNGRAIVDSAPRELAEMIAFQLHHHGLRVTLEQA